MGGGEERDDYTLVHFDIGTMVTFLGQSTRFRPFGKASFTARTAEFGTESKMKHSMRGVVRRGSSMLAFLLMGALWGCQTRDLSPPPLDPVPMERSGYVVGVQDVLQINVWKNEELSVTVPVRSDGKISVPLVDDVQAEGLQAMEIKEVLTRELSEFITAPDVTVVVLEMNSRYVNVIGEIGRAHV